MPRGCAQLHVHGNDIGLTKDLLLSSVADGRFGTFVRRQVWAPGNHPHAEGVSNAGDLCAESTEPDDAQRLAAEVHADAVLPELAILHTIALASGSAGKLKHQRKGQFDRRMR